MNEYNINVDFIKGRISTNLRNLVQNDYNSTKLNFTFDKEGRVLFKMLYPDGTQYVDEVKNNILIFGPGILNQEGAYEYEISLYTEDGRLTDYATKSFEVRSELVDTDKLVTPDDRVPVLDTLINEVSTIKQDVEDGKYNGKDGVNGIDGKNGATPNIGDNGNWFIDGIDTGMPSQGSEGPQGPAGGVSIEEVQEITGSLENLNTEDKSNLVGAINEAMNSGGSDGLVIGNIPTYTIKPTSTSPWYPNGNWPTNSYSILSKEEIQAIIQEVYDAGYEGFNLLMLDSSYNYLFIPRTYGLLSKPTTITLESQHMSSGINKPCVSTLNIRISWTDEVATVSSASISTKTLASTLNSDYLAKTNTTAFTPTGDYNPATKKYVDDAIATLKAELGGTE